MAAAPVSKVSQADFAARQDGLRAEMKKAGVDGFLIPVADEYQSEYPPFSARRMGFLTGFTGSAGSAIVLAEDAIDPSKTKGDKNAKAAAVFVDGRYTLQAKQQVDQTRYEQKDLTTDPVSDWAVSRLKPGSKLAYDPWMHTQAQVEGLKKKLDAAGIELTPVSHNLVDAVWKDRPPVSKAKVQVHGEQYAGESSASKRERVGKSLGEKGVDAAVITAPDAIAWLLNVRGGDVPATPVALSFAVLHKDGKVDWFIDPDKLSADVKKHVGKDVTAHDIKDIGGVIDSLGKSGKTVQYDDKRSSSWFHQRLEASGAKIVNGDDPTLLPKALKNDVEIEGMRQSHIRDGAALTKFLAWLDEEVTKRPVTETEVDKKLLSFRQAQKDFKEVSFDTIAGSGEHGAIVHYRATEESNKVLEKDTLFLLDSGGQYLDGTTDVTRTMVIGQPTDEMKKRFTQVLQGHIGIATAVFPKGVTGQQLDVLARGPLWAEGEDYAHGTGHGVGSFLGVHEGPQGIHRRSDVAFQPGMILSNEPGYYKTGEFGIRTESLVVVKEKAGTGGDTGKPPYYEFETITMAPIDRRLVDVDMLTDKELNWLNAYHQKVQETLAPAMDKKELEWLKQATRPLEREAAKTVAEVKGKFTGNIAATGGTQRQR
ncbi:MAG: aminopeptidase P family protein [Alphaproteobacteria bacterium]|nr:aminopeptidase P family protein [Alphaproteobacteria bacterium]